MTYRVIGQCAHVTVEGFGGGKYKQLIYRGSVVPDSATDEEIRHLVSINAIAKVDDGIGTHEAPRQVDTDRTGTPPAPTTDSADPTAPPPVDPEVARKRAEAKAKLPADGSAPDGRASDAVLVEYLVGKGYDRGEAEKASSSDLRKLAKDAASK